MPVPRHPVLPTQRTASEPPASAAPVPRPLLLSADELLIAEVRRLAAAAGVPLEVAATGLDGVRRWLPAAVVLVGSDLAETGAAHQPPRRERVHVVGAQPLGDLVFRHAVGLGAESVAALPESAEWLVELLTDVADEVPAPGPTIGVIGGCGGAGATVLAAALAAEAARQDSALLVDADPLGAGVERVIGLESSGGVRWDAMLQSTGRLSGRSLRETLPRQQGLSVLTWPSPRPAALQPFAVREVLSAGRRGFGCVVVDLPRQIDGVVEEALLRCDRVVVVSPLSVAAVAAATRVIERLPEAVPAGLVTRGRGGVPATDAARMVRLPLLAEMPDQRGLDESLDLGLGPLRSSRGALARTARTVVDALVTAPRSAA